MKKLRLFQDKRKLKIFAIRAMIYLIIIGAIVLLSSIIGRADTEYTLTSNYIFRSNNATVVPSGSFSQFISNWIEIPLETSWTWTYPSYVVFNLNELGLTSFNITPSNYFSGSSGNTYVCFFFGYVVNDNIIRVPNTSSVNTAYGESFSMSDLSIPVEATQIILSIQKGSYQNNRYYTSYPQLTYTPLVPPAPPDPPTPDEWQTLIEFIGYLIDSVVNVFNLTFSIESKLVWALVFGFPILNYVLDFFDEILDQIDASLPADHDLHKYRPAGYQAPNYYDYHFDYDYWIHNKSMPGG